MVVAAGGLPLVLKTRLPGASCSLYYHLSRSSVTRKGRIPVTRDEVVRWAGEAVVGKKDRSLIMQLHG